MLLYPGATAAEAPARQHTSRPIVTGTSVLGIKVRPPTRPAPTARPRSHSSRAQYKDGVMLAADTLASYGSLAMFKDVTRIARTGSYTLVGASGELSDYHALLDKLKGLAQANANCDDGFEHGPAEIYSYLRAVLYQRRNKFDPLWNSLVVGGFKDGAPFLGSVDLRGTAYEDDVIATGYGSHLALPIMRAKWTPDLDEGEARALLEDCLRVLFYRDCRALDTVVLSKATATGTLVSDPYKLETDWTSASFVAPKAGGDGDGGW